MRHRLAWTHAPAALLMAASLACAGEGSDERQEPPASGGAASGQGGGGGSAGVPEECRPGSLSKYCGEHACPTSPEAVERICNVMPGRGGTSKSSTLCGGTYVVANDGISGTGYYFDGQEMLVGVVTGLSDCGAFACPSGFWRGSYGTTCTLDLSVPTVNLCMGGTGAGGSAGSSGAGGG